MTMHTDLPNRLTSHEKWSYGLGRTEPYLGEWDDIPAHRDGRGPLWRWLDGAWVLDLDDAATAGVLLQVLTDELSSMSGYLVASVDTGESLPWCFELCPKYVGDSAYHGRTLGEAAALTLLALWGRHDP